MCCTLVCCSIAMLLCWYVIVLTSGHAGKREWCYDVCDYVIALMRCCIMVLCSCVRLI